ncbi:hypothetical protein [Rickettsia endosymbiont of Polydrusus tereticollis]|uniref:hypothetical protein n=1 Tax=Rickettsia endosymbiont of Polydrusus tereticollis TaxID=3066251 RepID=UPI003132A3DE
MYNQSPEQVKSILDVWKIIEVLTPNKNENLNKYYEELEKHKKGNGGTFCKKLSDNDALLLLKDNPFKNVINKQNLGIDLTKYEVSIYWNVYLGYLDWSTAEIDIIKKIIKLSDIQEEKLRNHRNQERSIMTPIAALILDEDMNYIEGSMIISTAAYALGIIIQPDFSEKDFENLADFENNTNILINNLISEYAIAPEESDKELELRKKFDLESVNLMIDGLVEKLDIDKKYLLEKTEICVKRVISKKLKKNTTAKDHKNLIYYAPLEMFNSFFLKQLDFLRTRTDKYFDDSAYAKYMGASDKPNSLDVLEESTEKPKILQDLLDPLKMQFARWPSSPNNSLALLQAAAINSIFNKTATNQNLFAINGPPGTGKTTLLFDVIANLYVTRAVQLASLKTPAEGFESEGFSDKPTNFQHNIKPLKPSLQGYSIILASSNNNAVENISRELPLYAKIDQIYHKELGFFKQLFYKKDSWGIFAAILGKASNKQKFMNKFWSQEDEDTWQKKDIAKNPEEEIYTFCQYFNLLTNNKCVDKAPEHFKPKYCNSLEDTNKEWTKACTEFNELHKKNR